MKKRFIPLCVILIILLAGSVFAEDVAYVYRKTFMIDNNVLGIFDDMGLSVELIDESDLSGINWDDYKLIFVGEENFRNDDLIPIGEKASVVANSYHGKEWGLTDDSISKLGSTGPLYVRLVDDGIKQVYTQAAYSSTISIPYHYLGNTPEHNNMPSGLTPIAGTYQGDSYSLGAVVAYGDVGGQLWTKQLDAKLCFFGIMDKTGSYPLSSNYWTQNAQDLFEDCVVYVASECEDDSDCGGDGFIGDTYCSNDDVYQDYIEYSCENGLLGECSDETNPELIEECGFGCFEGECLPGIHDIALSDLKIKDTSGGLVDVNALIAGQDYRVYIDLENLGEHIEDVIFEGFVGSLDFQHEAVDDLLPGEKKNDKYRTVEFALAEGDYELNVTGTIAVDDNLDDNFVSMLVSVFEVSCLDDEDCPGYVEGESYCVENNVYRNNTVPVCLLPGTINSSCIVEEQMILNETCSDVCINGTCFEIECYEDADCGESGFVEERFCGNNGGDWCNRADINRDGIVNGTDLQLWDDNYAPLGGCTEPDWCNQADIDMDGDVDGQDLAIWQQEWGNTCQEFGQNVYQFYREFTCSNPGTPESSCNNETTALKIADCLYGCEDGECLMPECYEDADCDDSNAYTYDWCENPSTLNSSCQHQEINCASEWDCGYTGYINETYCFDNGIWKEFMSSSCINPGTPESYCENNITNFQLQDCDPYGICMENAHAYCYYPPAECYEDGDCGVDFYSANYCEDDNVYRDFTDYGCENTNCVSNVTKTLIQNCGEPYCENFGENYCKGKDVYHNQTCYDLGCSSGGCYNSSYVYEGLVENCTDYCEAGVCMQYGCEVDEDCGENGFIGDGYCSNEDIWQDYQEFFCISGECSDETNPQLITNCGEDYCDAWQENYCFNGDVYHDRECYNLGCASGNCFNISDTDIQLVENCSYGCEDGWCIEEPVECYTDDECDDQNEYTYDQCVNPGTVLSYCRNDEINCLNNNDCGINGFSENYCFNNNLYKNYQNSTCVNPGTLDSYCVININRLLVQKCVICQEPAECFV